MSGNTEEAARFKKVNQTVGGVSTFVSLVHLAFSRDEKGFYFADHDSASTSSLGRLQQGGR